MKVSTQNHIRDILGMIPAVAAFPIAYADLIKPVLDISPSLAHRWPFVLALSPILARGAGTAFRLWNTWYPPAPETPPQKPTTPQP